jgi:hypothetical protein
VGNFLEFPLESTSKGARDEFETPSPLTMAAGFPHHLPNTLLNHDPVVVRIDDSVGTDGANWIDGKYGEYVANWIDRQHEPLTNRSDWLHRSDLDPGSNGFDRQ